MSKKRVSYQNELKKAIAEFDTSKTVDVKGPMLDPILQWDGDGELPVYKDAASILERYYFNEKEDKGIEVTEMEYNEDGTEKKGEEMKHGTGQGTEQAGTADEATMDATKKGIAKDLAKEQEEMKDDEKEDKDEEEMKEAEYNDKDVPKKKKYHEEQENDKDEADEEDEEEMEESADLTEDYENAVIEKLISEMEEDDEEDDDDDDEEEMKESEEFEGVKKDQQAPKEKESKNPEEHTTGAGTEQAGTGDADGQVPDRKDVADKMVKPKKYTNEAEEMEDEEGDEEKELDVDKEIKEQGSGAGHVPPPSMQKKMKGEDQGDDDLYEEAFELFKEAIEEDDDQ